MKEKIYLNLPAKSKYVSLARLTVASIANNIGFDMEQVDDIKVAVGEACNNAILHGKGNESIDIVFIVNDNELIVEIEDFGDGFRVNEYESPDLNNPKEGGLGIFIIKTLMDNVNINSEIGEGTKIRMMKKRIV